MIWKIFAWSFSFENSCWGFFTCFSLSFICVVEVVTATIVNLWGFGHSSEIDLSAVWFSLTPVFIFYWDMWKILTWWHFHMCVCVFYDAHNVTYLDQGGGLCGTKILEVWFFLSLSVIFPLICLHFTLLPLLFSLFRSPLLSSFVLSSFIFHIPLYPFPFLCHHQGSKGFLLNIGD